MTSRSPELDRGPGRPRREAAEDVRERLLDAAVRLGRERGFDALGIREIAGEAGVSPGMIAYYFGDKAGLYRALFDRVYQKLVASLRRFAQTGGDEEAESPLARLVQLQISTIGESPWMPQLIVREVLSREGPLRDFFRERIASGPAQLVPALLRREMGAGRLRSDLDPTLVLLSLIGMVVFPFLAHPVLGDVLGYELDDDFRERLIEHTQRLLLEGVAAEKSR